MHACPPERLDNYSIAPFARKDEACGGVSVLKQLDDGWARRWNFMKESREKLYPPFFCQKLEGGGEGMFFSMPSVAGI